MTRVLTLCALAIVLTLALITLGGTVRATGAGLACPDWPLCHGRLIPPLEPLVLIEWSHRLLASLVGLATLLLAIAVWRAGRAARERVLRGGAVATLVLLGAQIALGGLTVRRALGPGLVAAHLGTAMAFLAALLFLYVNAWRLANEEPAPEDAPASAPVTAAASAPAMGVPRLFRLTALVTTAAAYGQILLGGYVSASGARLACPDFPLCRGALIPTLEGPVLIHFVHRVGALIVALLVTALVAQARQTSGPVRRLSANAAMLVIVQIALGALNIYTGTAPPITVAHLLGAAALFATLFALTTMAWTAPVIRAERRPWRSVAADYIALTKPRIILLLLVTTAPTMLVAAGGRIPAALLVYTLLGGTLAAGAANAINCYWDRDIDAVMARTRRRPVPAGRIPPVNALGFAFLLGALSLLVLGPLVNWTSAFLAFGGLLFYVFIYTMWLKRSTPQNIVIGGAAGSVPPLVGWAAVTGRVELPALVLFAIIFLWTPPHFWALALHRRQDYAAARIPMLPVVAGEAATKRQIFWYSLALVGASLLLVPLGVVGAVYLVAAIALGAGFLYLARAVSREDGVLYAPRLFGYSILYLMSLFVAMALDRLV